MNILLSRQTLANWMIKGAELLKPLADRMKEILLTKEILHADELCAAAHNSSYV